MSLKLYRLKDSFSIDDLTTELILKGGKIVQLFPPSFVIAEKVSATSLNSAEEYVPLPGWENFDSQAKMAILAFQRLTQVRARSFVKKSESWDSPGKQPPRYTKSLTPFATKQNYISNKAPVFASTGTETSKYLIGRVAVALVIVGREHGPGASAFPEHLTSTERDTAAAEAAEGLAWLSSLEPRAQVEFAFERHDIELSVAPSTTATTWEDFEAVWRDPALSQLGYSAGQSGYAQLARDVRDRNNASWGYVLFVTRYQLGHFAYASGERVVQHYDNDGWGTAELNRVIAHESCHIFGALDEYKDSKCKCTDKGGELQVENGNCRLCATSFVDCIMEANTLAICDYTKGQLGWKGPLLRWNFILQTGTGLAETNNDYEFFLEDWDKDGVLDLIVIKKRGTGTGKTEVHIFSGASNFQTPILQTGTGLQETDDSFQFCFVDWNHDGSIDLVAIKKNGTGTNSTEIHVFSGASGFQTPILQTGTGLHETDNSFKFAMSRWNLNPFGSRPDLFAIKKSNTGTNSTEVHVFSAASNYQTPILQTGTPLHVTDDTFDFLVAPFKRPLFSLPDLICIKKSNCGTKSTEIHVLSGISQFQNFMEQSGSQLSETDGTFAFSAARWGTNSTIDIAAIKKSNTGTGTTEVHILRQ